MALSFFKFQISCFNVFIFFIFGAGEGLVRPEFHSLEKYINTTTCTPNGSQKQFPHHNFKPVWQIWRLYLLSSFPSNAVVHGLSSPEARLWITLVHPPGHVMLLMHLDALRPLLCTIRSRWFYPHFSSLDPSTTAVTGVMGSRPPGQLHLALHTVLSQ